MCYDSFQKKTEGIHDKMEVREHGKTRLCGKERGICR